MNPLIQNHIILRFTNDDRDIEELIEEVGTYIVLTSQLIQIRRNK